MVPLVRAGPPTLGSVYNHWPPTSRCWGTLYLGTVTNAILARAIARGS